jgi:hypothetical protein
MTPRPQFQNVSNHFVQDWEPPQAEDDRGRGFSLKLPGGYWQWQTWASVQVWMPGEGEEDFDIFDTTRNSSIINQSCLAAGNCTIVVNGNWAVWTSRLLECGVWSISRASLSGKSSKQSCNWPKVLGRRALQNPCPLFQACQVMSDISISMEWIGHGLSCFEMLVVLCSLVMFCDVSWCFVECLKVQLCNDSPGSWSLWPAVLLRSSTTGTHCKAEDPSAWECWNSGSM